MLKFDAGCVLRATQCRELKKIGNLKSDGETNGTRRQKFVVFIFLESSFRLAFESKMVDYYLYYLWPRL